jgi:tetratricopeptide (TPR) repeat protein
MPNTRKTKEEWLQEAESLEEVDRYEEALAACEQALRLAPNSADASTIQGWALIPRMEFQAR